MHNTETVDIVPPSSENPYRFDLDRGFLQIDRTAVINAIQAFRLSPALTGVLMLLAMHVRWDNPSRTLHAGTAADIAAMINTTPKVARKHLKDLEAVGAIEWHRAQNDYTGSITLMVDLERPKKPKEPRRKRERVSADLEPITHDLEAVPEVESGTSEPVRLEPVAEVESAGLEHAEPVTLPPVPMERMTWAEWNRLPEAGRRLIPQCHPEPADAAGLEADADSVDIAPADPVGVPVGVPKWATPNDDDSLLLIRTKKNPPTPHEPADADSPQEPEEMDRISIEGFTKSVLDAVADEICDRRESAGWGTANEPARRKIRNAVIAAGLDRVALEWQALNASHHRIVQAIAERVQAMQGEAGNLHAVPFDLGELDDHRRRKAEACPICDDGWVYLEAERASRICDCQNLSPSEVIR
jgi:DNA-binding MarR family transcriptional regulator